MTTDSRKRPRYSVMRIERAKQRALTGQSFKLVNPKRSYLMDWTSDDEAALCALIEQWDEKTGHVGLNKLIDYYQFSAGQHYNLAKIDQLQQIKNRDGRMRYNDDNRYPWMREVEQPDRFKRSGT